MPSKESYILAIKEDLAMGLFQDREEEARMREEIREYEEYQEYCRETQAELEYDARRIECWEQFDA